MLKLRLLTALMAGALFLVGCSAVEKQIYDVASDMENMPVGIEHEGAMYSNGEYVLEIIRTDKNRPENTYNVILFSAKSGDQKFFATVTGKIENGVCASDIDENKAIEIEKMESDSFSVSYTYNGKNVASASGIYKSMEENWTPLSAEKKAYIKAGVYRNGEYRLSVYESGEVLRFIITNADGKIVFEGTANEPGNASSVTVNYDGVAVEIAAGLNEGKLFLEIAGYSSKYECRYSGIFEAVEK